MLRFWTGGDKTRSFTLFLQSGLNRAKWEREDYRESTWKQIDNGSVFSEVQESTSQRFDELANLDFVQYDQCRIDEASQLGIRVSTLDQEVAKRRKLAMDAATIPVGASWVFLTLNPGLNQFQMPKDYSMKYPNPLHVT